MKNYKKSLGGVKLVIALWAMYGWQGCLKKTEVGDSSDLQGNVSEGSDYLWPNATASVCWEKNIPQVDWDQFAPMRTKIAEYVTSQMARAGFTLNGWQACDINSMGMRVEQRKKQPTDWNTGIVKALGRKVDGKLGGVSLVMDHESTAVASTALHEFGHAIGLRHEANRSDSPCARDQYGGLSEENYGALPQGAYDPDSIMNYCKLSAGKSTGLLVPLSQGDIATIKALYSGPPQFPREETCRKDGNSWVADAYQSCCRLVPGKSEPPHAEYPICTTDNTVPEPKITRLLSQGAYWTVLKTPFQNTGWRLSCKENDYFLGKKPESVGDLSEVTFDLNQAAGLQRDTFTCSHIDAFDMVAADSKGADPTRKMARLTFPSPVVIKINQAPSKIDNSSLPWQYFDNVQAAPTTSPVGVQPSQNPAQIATKQLQLLFDMFPMGMVVSAAYINCGSEKITGQAVVSNTKNGAGSVIFTLPANLSCQGTELKIGVPKPNSGENPQPTAASLETQFLNLKFDKPIDLNSKDQFTVVIKAPQCLSISSTPAPTPSASTNTAPQPPTSQSAAPQPALISSSCDMSQAAENQGWGYDHTKKESCKGPVATPKPETPQPAASEQQADQTTSNCDLSQAAENQGYGYDHTIGKSCKCTNSVCTIQN